MSDWTCLLYSSISGAVIGELPLAEEPNWSRQLNGSGSISVKTIAGAAGVPAVSSLREYSAGLKYGVALVWNKSNWISTLGPIVSASYDDGSDSVQFGAVDMWGMLNRRVLANSAWTPGTRITDTSADIIYPNSSLHDIAIGIVRHGLDQPSGTLNIDTPALDSLGGNTRTYQGYDCVSIGQRLQELTQVQMGPDIDFQGYFSAPGIIRVQLLVGSPNIVQPGSSVVWDYGSGLQQVSVDADSSNLATRVTAKGSGTGYDMITSTVTDLTLPPVGWPIADFIDSGHTSVSEQTTLDQYAASDLYLYGRPVEKWSVVVRSDVAPGLGEYQPGFYAKFNMQNHVWIPDGAYFQRILSLGSGSDGNTVALGLEAIQGTV